MDFSISRDDARLMIRAIDALRGMGPSPSLDARLAQLQQRIAARLPQFSEGDVRNICLGLEVLLRDNPLDWGAETLLRRLTATLPDPQKSP